MSLTVGTGSVSAAVNKPITVLSGTGATYWVSPTGISSYANACSTTPLSGTTCCSLATANAGVHAGETVFLRGGMYHYPLHPMNSGTASQRVYFRNYGSEKVILYNNNVGDIYYFGIYLDGVSYISVLGINVVTPPYPSIPQDRGQPLAIWNGASYNEIAYCDIDGNQNGFVSWRISSFPSSGGPVTNNWMHHCSIHDIGRMYYGTNNAVDQYMGMTIGSCGVGYDTLSGNNTIENCHFYHEGHNLLEFYTCYNVIKNNYFHNEGWLVNNTGHEVTDYYPDTAPPADWPFLWGHRCLQIANALGAQPSGQPVLTALHCLFEGNRFGHAGPPAENGGGECLTIGAPKNIFRFNDIFNATNNGVLFKQTCPWDGPGDQADFNMFYNNTLYKAGRHNNAIAPDGIWQGYSVFAPSNWPGYYYREGNVIINNIMNTYGGVKEIDMDTTLGSTPNIVTSNFLTANGDPKFKNTDVSDPFNLSAPDLSLQASSPCIGGGTNLTKAVGAGSSATTLVVGNSLFFQDGTWGAKMTHGVTLFPDVIAIGTVGNTVAISSIDYKTNAITLASPITWSDGAPIWLYKNSSGQQVLYGTAPDLGAHPVVR